MHVVGNHAIPTTTRMLSTHTHALLAVIEWPLFIIAGFSLFVAGFFLFLLAYGFSAHVKLILWILMHAA